jgi:hypothetical protein
MIHLAIFAMAQEAGFTRDDLEQAFAALGEKARAAGKIVEIAVDGGSALVLIMPGRSATKDVDAVIDGDTSWVRRAAAELAEERGWPPDWLNDGVKGWLSARDKDPEAKSLFKSYPSEEAPGLRVMVAAPAYLFAMKCLAMRIGGVDATRDRSDIEALAGELGISTAAQALNLVSRYYPAERISAKTRFGIEELFAPGANDSRPHGG